MRPAKAYSKCASGRFIGTLGAIWVACVSGYVPLRKRRDLIVGETREQERALQRVEVMEVGRASVRSR